MLAATFLMTFLTLNVFLLLFWCNVLSLVNIQSSAILFAAFIKLPTIQESSGFLVIQYTNNLAKDLEKLREGPLYNGFWRVGY